jgi:hypothetical protein
MNSLDKIITDILQDNYDDEFDPYDDEYLLEDYPCKLFYHERYNQEFLNKLLPINLVFKKKTIKKMLDYYEDNFDDDIIEAVKNNDLKLLAMLYACYATKRFYIEIKEDLKVAKKIFENFKKLQEIKGLKE